ncbi:putative phage tail protein [Cytobacillus massiliigabonensis]|uniref:putative phage tail protein n=1 Tax=Cytobacillus massiliigabonensis TaxID=1871011 RepID=UPI0015E15488|nr:putative phage tail protein [Cytobacillus massiliigabonensis]
MNDYLIQEIKLQKYLPPTVNELKEMQEIVRVENENFNEVRLNLINIFKTRFINETNEIGISRWEKMLKINAAKDETLQFRKSRLLSRMQGKEPYTIRYLKKLLNALLGETEYQVNLDIINEHLEVLMSFGSGVSAEMQVRYYKELSELLDKVVPLNLGIGITHRRSINLGMNFGGLISTRNKIQIRPAAFKQPSIQQTKYYAGFISMRTITVIKMEV